MLGLETLETSIVKLLEMLDIAQDHVQSVLANKSEPDHKVRCIGHRRAWSYIALAFVSKTGRACMPTPAGIASFLALPRAALR